MLPPGQPTLLVGAMHAGEIDTVLDQSVKATADVDLWHIADNRCVAIVCPLLDQSGHWWVSGPELFVR